MRLCRRNGSVVFFCLYCLFFSYLPLLPILCQNSGSFSCFGLALLASTQSSHLHMLLTFTVTISPKHSMTAIKPLDLWVAHPAKHSMNTITTPTDSLRQHHIHLFVLFFRHNFDYYYVIVIWSSLFNYKCMQSTEVLTLSTLCKHNCCNC